MPYYNSKLPLMAAAALISLSASAQLSTNPDKFLGNITTSGQVNFNNLEFASLWNQITPENESKWSSIEGSRNNFNWTGCDRCYNYARQNNFPLKFHTLIWGSQYPSWMDGLTTSTQYKEIVEWMDAIKERYPDLDMIDVVNEAIPGHAPAPYKNALGGDGITGYDWIIKAFEMAHERWPEAILIYNDYNTFQWQKSEFINLVKVIRDAGAPIDAYGCQSHDLTDINFSTFKSAMTEIQNALKMPMYSSEYDIGTSDDQKQLNQYRDQIPYMWEQPYVAGITLWGYIYGRTWVTDGVSGIIKDGVDRPAMTWLREYMASDAAKTATSPFPGFKKEASIYVRPEHYLTTVNEPMEIEVDATLRTKEIEKVELYVKNRYYGELTEAPYVFEYTPTSKGSVSLKAVVTSTDGQEWTRLGGFKAYGARQPFSGEPISLPGIVEFENFDIGGEGYTYHDTDSKNEGTSAYRSDSEGVDIIAANDGYAIGYTATGEWLEYTVDLTEKGRYTFELTASSGSDNASVQLLLFQDGEQYEATSQIAIDNTGSWDTYQIFKGASKSLKAGQQTLRVCITGGMCNIDKILLKKGSNGIVDASMLDVGEYDVYTTSGLYVGHIQLSAGQSMSGALSGLTSRTDIFVVKNASTGEATLVKAAY